MKFRSIQFSVATLAGASVLAVVVALVLYALFAGARTQELVQSRTETLLEQAIAERLQSLAAAQVSDIQRELAAPMSIAATVAQTNALLGQTAEDGSPALSASRKELLNLLRHLLSNNPKLIDLYVGWQPNAFGNDADNIGTPGHDEAGRFMPWFYRDGNALKVEPLGATLESEKLLPTGVREGQYYLCPRETLKPCVVDPAPTSSPARW